MQNSWILTFWRPVGPLTLPTSQCCGRHWTHTTYGCLFLERLSHHYRCQLVPCSAAHHREASYSDRSKLEVALLAESPEQTVLGQCTGSQHHEGPRTFLPFCTTVPSMWPMWAKLGLSAYCVGILGPTPPKEVSNRLMLMSHWPKWC